MKIIQVIGHLELAGAQRVFESLCLGLQKQGVEVMAVSFWDYHTSISENLEKQGIKVIYLNAKKWDSLIPLYKLFKKEKPDVVHTHLNAVKFAFPAAWLAGVPLTVQTIHCIAEKDTSTYTRKCIKFYLRSKRFVLAALSPMVQDSIVNFYNLEKIRTPYVLNGVLLEKCIEKKSYKFGDSINIIHVGRFDKAKNHLGLLKAILLLNNKGFSVNLTIVGKSHAAPEIENEIQSFISENHMEAYVNLFGETDNVYPLLNKADIFALPSLWEGVPMVIIEAMATGLPIVASAVGGIPDMLQDGKTGLLCGTDAESIAASLEKFISDEALRSKCGRNALKDSVRFSSEEMAKGYLKIYRG